MTSYASIRNLGLALALSCACGILSAATPSALVEVLADLTDRFEAAQKLDCLDPAVRRSATAGGVKLDALFGHPRDTTRPARLVFDLELPEIEPDDLLFLAFSVALQDGVRMEEGADGVRFRVEVEGTLVFTQEWRKTQWRPAAVNLATFAGRKVRVALLTDAQKDTRYDWALWGSPRVVRVRGSESLQAGRTAIVTGALAVRCAGDGPLTVILKPIGSGAPVEWPVPPTTQPDQPWTFIDFSWSDADGVEVDWKPKEALTANAIRVAAYPAMLKFTQLSPATAIPLAGHTVPIRFEVKNEGRGLSSKDSAEVRVQIRDQKFSPKPLPRLGPGESWQGAWEWATPPSPSQFTLNAELASAAGRILARHATSIHTLPAVKGPVVENSQLRFEFYNAGSDAAFARLFGRLEGSWKEVGVWHPLMRITIDSGPDSIHWRVPLRHEGVPAGTTQPQLAATFAGERVRDPRGMDWNVGLQVTLNPTNPTARIEYTWEPARETHVRQLLGPNLYVGDGGFGTAKSWGLFPGLEYLFGPESSSNPRDFAPQLADRRTPHPHKITMPLMAVTVGAHSRSPPPSPARFFTPDSLKDFDPPTRTNPPPATDKHAELTLGLYWNPLQKWDGERAFPGSRFASPNFDEGMSNHRLALFLPSVPELVQENRELAANASKIAAGQKLTLDATLVLTPGPATTIVREWLRARGGLPAPHPWPRTFQEELDICRSGFLKTVWDEKAGQWRHCIDWPSSPAPGFAALLWMDSQATQSPAARQRSRERVDQVAARMLRDSGAALLTSQANCHIMQWEFPFLYGHLPDAFAAIEGQISHLLQTQRPDGGWVYEPANPEQAGLGEAGDSVLGTCANRAATLLRYARITGDARTLAAGEQALRFMERFRVPRGGQTWECPMYEPDILAAAYAIKAGVDAWRCTGNSRWLHFAVYWAETGVPFVYLWTLPDKPMMLGATIPVFGSTFYTHSWLAVPVQWCGLVYAYHLQHLARELERHPLDTSDSPLPLALDFKPADWKRLAELITVSGMYQQFADGEKIGAYPDSITNFEKRQPAFINPEDILVNVLTLKGFDPDVETARTDTPAGEIVISSGAHIKILEAAENAVKFQLLFFEGEPSHSLVGGFKPREVRAGGKLLAESASPVRRDPGWWWDSQRSRLYLTVAPGETETQEIQLLR